MDNKVLLFLGLIFGAFILMALAAAAPVDVLPGPAKVFVLLVALALDVGAFASRYYANLMIPMLKQHRKSIVVSDEDRYRLSESGDALITRTGEGFLATAYAMIPLYTSGTEMSPEERLEFGKQVGRLISVNREPARFSTQMRVMDKDFYIGSIRDTISATENELVTLMQKGAPDAETARLRGRIEMWRGILDTVGKSQSLELVSYASVSASGTNEFEAVSMAQQKARDLISGISTTLGIAPLMIVGDELRRFIEPEYMVPYTTVSEELSRKVEEEVI